MRFKLRPGRPLLAAAVTIGLTACGRASGPSTEAPSPSSTPPPADSTARPDDQGPGLLELCRLEPEQEDVLSEARRHLHETFCGATLWFDGLFGNETDVENARNTSGRVELSGVYSDFHGVQPDARIRLRYDLPNLERRVNVFLGRGDRHEIARSREEGLAIRSSTVAQQAQEKWLAGLGYSPPGSWGRWLDLRVGIRPRTSPEVFVHTRLRKYVLVSDVSLWRLRETFFWESREGFGATTHVDYDRVLTPSLLFHWSNVGTVSEASEGLDWRSAALLYHNLGSRRSVAGELFVRGATSADVPFREYGARAIYRQPVFRPFFYGEVVLGYSWPRHELDQVRSGSPMFGVGGELLFGRAPP